MKIPGQYLAIAALLTLASTIATAENGYGQAALLGPGAAYIGAGVARLDTDDLDDRLTALGYPSFGTTAAVVGIGAYRTLSGGLMLGFEGNGLLLGEEDHEGGEVGVGGGYATLGLGYQVPISRRARIYPRLGIGVGGLGVWIETAEDTVEFDEVLDNPTATADLRQPVLSRDGMVIDVGGGIEFIPRRRGTGFLVGLRFGYLFAPWDSSWDFYERTAANGPDASISGAYVRLNVGGAWRR